MPFEVTIFNVSTSKLNYEHLCDRLEEKFNLFLCFLEKIIICFDPSSNVSHFKKITSTIKGGIIIRRLYLVLSRNEKIFINVLYNLRLK